MSYPFPVYLSPDMNYTTCILPSKLDSMTDNQMTCQLAMQGCVNNALLNHTNPAKLVTNARWNEFGQAQANRSLMDSNGSLAVQYWGACSLLQDPKTKACMWPEAKERLIQDLEAYHTS